MGNRQQPITCQPLWPAADKKNKIVVVSDLHFAVQSLFSKNVRNRPVFIEFLRRLQQTADVKELVIAGDFLDEWVLPLSYPPIKAMPAFFRRNLAAISDVIQELKHVMEAGIKLVYVVGNHDMNLDPAVMAEVLPGIVQPRDAAGLCRYTTGERNEILIEHGHRYDPYSAPDSVSNSQLFQGCDFMYPPGYFYSRMHTTWVLEQRPFRENFVPVVKEIPPTAGADLTGAYLYAKEMEVLFRQIPVNEGFTDKVFAFKRAGQVQAYSLADLYPLEQDDGTLSAPVLFRDFQRTWPARQKINDVWLPCLFTEAGAQAITAAYYRLCAERQYLDRGLYDIVVFGHTHEPDLSRKGDTYYINTGAWIDAAPGSPDKGKTYAVIETGRRSWAELHTYE